MAYLGFGNRIIKFGNNILNSGETFFFKFSGISFPEIRDENNNAIIQLRFSTAEKITINYGNGVIIEYQSYFVSTGVYEIIFRKKGGNTTSTNINTYNYPDNTLLSRVVSINFDRQKLIYFNISSLKLEIGDFLFEITKYPALKFFSIPQLTIVVGLNLEGSILTSQINEVIINSSFHNTSPYYTSVPDKLFQMPLKTLAIGSPGMSGGFATTKFDQIYRLATTLDYLKIEQTPITTLPSNFNLLTILKKLELIATNHTVIPSEINSIPSIENLFVGYNSFLTSWGNIANLVNLKSLQLISTPNLSNVLPAYLNGFTLLKNVDRKGSLKTQINVDAWVDNWYSFIVSNAAISGINTLQFRGMTHNISQLTLTSDGTFAPSGIYQQPSGFVLGSSNGTPATPKEKIWVMVNQYGHVWTTN